MDSRTLAKEIEQDEARLNYLIEQLDSALEATHADIVGFASTWINGAIKGHIERHPKLIQELDPDKLKSFKNDVEALKARLPEVVVGVLSENTAPHKERPRASLSSSQNYSTRPQSTEPFFNAVVRGVINNLGSILNTYGLLPPQDRSSFSEWQKAGSFVRYAINPGFDERDHPNVMKYRELHRNYKKTSQDLDNKRKQLDKLKAQELWDSI